MAKQRGPDGRFLKSEPEDREFDELDLDLPDDDEAEGEWYHVGTLASCPCQNVELAGVSFPRYTNPPVRNEDGSVRTGARKLPDRQWRKGDYIFLSDAKVEAIKEAASFKVCWWSNDKSRGTIYDTRYPLYNRRIGTEPLARHIFMYPASEAPPHQMVPGGTWKPKTLSETDDRWKSRFEDNYRKAQTIRRRQRRKVTRGERSELLAG